MASFFGGLAHYVVGDFPNVLLLPSLLLHASWKFSLGQCVIIMAHIIFFDANNLFPKASFFRSMAGGVPSGATEGGVWVPPPDCFFQPFRVHFWEPRLLRKPFFARKNHYFEVHFGVQNGVLREPGFSRFSLFSGSFLGTPFVPKTLFCTRKNQNF